MRPSTSFLVPGRRIWRPRDLCIQISSVYYSEIDLSFLHSPMVSKVLYIAILNVLDIMGTVFHWGFEVHFKGEYVPDGWGKG